MRAASAAVAAMGGTLSRRHLTACSSRGRPGKGGDSGAVIGHATSPGRLRLRPVGALGRAAGGGS
ncbi:hypothetical protein [Actinomadura verrucosospora]